MKRIDLIKYLVPIVLAAILVVMCRDNQKKPGLVYMPDMDPSLAYEYQKRVKYSDEQFTDWATTLKPVEGSIPIGHQEYHLPNTPEGYNEAVTRTENPVALTEESLLRGQEIYTIHCQPCHGPGGKGQGSAVVGSENRLAPPPIDFTNPTGGPLTAGRIFHVVTYGRNLMGAYASQVNVEDRWNVVHYVQSLNESDSTLVVDSGVDASETDASLSESEGTIDESNESNEN